MPMKLARRFQELSTVCGVSVFAFLIPAQSALTPLKFEVASIKTAEPWTQVEAASGQSHRGIRITPGRVDIRFVSLPRLIALAYGIDPSQLMGPDWLIHPTVSENQLFDIQAITPPGSTKDQVQEMLRTLLADRFMLTTHKSIKEEQAYALVLSGGPLRLKAASPKSTIESAGKDHGGSEFEVEDGTKVRINSSGNITVAVTSGPDIEMRVTQERFVGGMDHIEAFKITMPYLARRLSNVCDRRVVDRTGLNSAYQFTIDLPKSGAGHSNPKSNSVATSLAKLGMRLEERKVPVEYLVVDHLSKSPTPN
jgi:uncharacterized protein (TIGR03435 family)